MKKKFSSDSYKTYKKKCNEPVSNSMYRLVLALFNQYLIKNVLDGKEVSLPSRLGTLSIKGRKQKIEVDENGNIIGLAPDYKATREYWKKNPKAAKEKKLIYHMNYHTDQVRYKFYWSKKNVLVENKILYSLILSRANKRAAANLIKNGKDYPVKILNNE